MSQALARLQALVDVAPIVPSPQRLGYRARVKLVVRKAKAEVLTGLYAPGSHRVVDISSCPVHAPAVNPVVRYLKREIPRAGIVPYDETRDTGQLRYLDLRYSAWRRELVVTLVTRNDDFPGGLELSRTLKRRFPFVSGVVQNVNEDRGNVIWGKRFRTLLGRDTLVERFGSLQLGFPAGVFSQANPAAARTLYETVAGLAGLRGDETVLDLYCGVGPVSLHLAKRARSVWGIDESSLATAAAGQNARMNGFHNCRFFTGNVTDRVREAKIRLPRIDAVTVNPPRKGIQPDAMEAILSLAAPKIVYVSCDPLTLARDLETLVRREYRLLAVRPFDMFPQTDQVETVTLLTRERR